MDNWLSTAPSNPSRDNRPPDRIETEQDEATSSAATSDGPPYATTAGTTVTPSVTTTASSTTPMDMEDTNGGATSIGIIEESESSSSSSSSSHSSASIFEEHDRRDDVQAPALVLLAARNARRSIHNDTAGGFGLVTHSFLIRRRTAGEQKKRKARQPQQLEDLHADWGVECLVCGTGKVVALDKSTSTNPPL